MHFSQRAYVLIMLTAVLAVAGIWSSDPAFGVVADSGALLLLGLGIRELRYPPGGDGGGCRDCAARFSGSRAGSVFTFHNESSRAVAVEYAPVMPVGLSL